MSLYLNTINIYSAGLCMYTYILTYICMLYMLQVWYCHDCSEAEMRAN